MKSSLKPPLPPVKEHDLSHSQYAPAIGGLGASSFSRMKEGESGPNSTRENPLNGSQNSFINNNHHKKSHSVGINSHTSLPDVHRPGN